jgi:hypothetical protein
MKERSANSYDVRLAQQILSNLLSTSEQKKKEGFAEVDAGYLRLSSGTITRPAERTPAPSPAASAVDSMMETAAAQQKFSGWESCIAWCMSVTKAEAAFVADSQGFIIASRGRVPAHGFEGTGAELICSVDQLERVDPDAGKLAWVDLDFDKRRIVGFIPPSVNSGYYVLGLIAPDPGYPSLKQYISRQIIENLPNLD